MAFRLKGNVSVDQLANAVGKSLRSAIERDVFHFPHLVGEPFRLDEEFKAFLFRDIYFDTQDLAVLNAGAAYRLRHRWSRAELYPRHKLFPFVKSFYPNRAEIQFKSGYDLDFERQVVSPTETRFEFRNESAPFDVELDAPVAPWPEQEYIGYAQSGRFRQYKIKPMLALKETLESKQEETPALEPKVKLLTVRDRIHLNVKNPWGSGPNPEQVFIITLDKFTIADGYGRIIPEEVVLELEVEIERNVSTELDRIKGMAMDEDIRFSAIRDQAIEFSSEAWVGLNTDLETIRDLLSKEIVALTGSTPLPLDYKYSRVMGMLMGRRHSESLNTLP